MRKLALTSLILFTAFGGGLTWGAMVVQWQVQPQAAQAGFKLRLLQGRPGEAARLLEGRAAGEDMGATGCPVGAS